MEELTISAQICEFRSKIPKDLLQKWETPTGWRCIIKLVQDWTILLTAHQLFVRYPSPLTFVISLSLMSWGQRALSKLAHDSIHRNLFHSKKLNDLVANIFLSPPAMSTARIQRLSHAAHHHYLGTKSDPDHGDGNETSLRHYREHNYTHKSILSLFLYDLADPLIFRQNCIGSLLDAPMLIITWWLIVTIMTSYLEPPSTGGIRYNAFVPLFHIARCTIGHIFFVLGETIDHSGLESGTVMGFTRSSPWGSFFQKYLYPHDDNYHIVHHLLPRVPMSHLKEVEGWLRENVVEYDKTAGENRFEAYFMGEKPLFEQALYGKKAREIKKGRRDSKMDVSE